MGRGVGAEPDAVAAAPIGGPRLLERVAKALLVGLAYYVTARLSLRLALVGRNVTPLWPPTGIAVVAILILGRSIWPGIAAAALLVNLPISTNALAAATTAVGNTAAPVLAAILLSRMGFHREIDRLRDAVTIIVSALVSTLVSATVGAGTLVLSGVIPRSDFGPAWAVWWTGDAMGILLVAPFLLSLFPWRRGPRASWWRRIEAVGLFLLLVVLTVAVLHSRPRLLFPLLPVLGWAAWRFQQRGAAPAALVVGVLATWAADHAWAPFANESLLARMVTLQAFNATVALTSFFFAALVTERMRDREALQRAAADLEDRVRVRTAELNQREQQLAEAQHIARVGSWEWLIPEDRVSWSDEMFRIHGYAPQEFTVTFDRAVELVPAEDRERIRGNVASALQKRQNHTLRPNEYRIVRPDGMERVLLGRASLTFGSDGEPLRMMGTVQDITEEKQARREHDIAATLQRSLLPEQLPEIPGVTLAVRYVPATTGMEIGGDWYDVVPLSDGSVGLAIGDVAGHGLRAAATMGQLRMALRAYALEGNEPGQVVRRVRELVRRLIPSEMATLLYLVLDPDAMSITFSNAGHLPPLVIADGEAYYLEGGLAPPLGAAPHPGDAAEATAQLEPDSTLVLFTDGLVERRGVSLRHGLDQLSEEARVAPSDLESMCDHLLASLLGAEVFDDVAMLALRPIRFAGDRFHLSLPAEPFVLASLRHALRRWLREAGAEQQEAYEILVACGEACANAIQHPHGIRVGSLEIVAAASEGEVDIQVRDTGTWRDVPPPDGGHGLKLMRDLMDSVEVSQGQGGTTVRMRRRLGVPATR
jgi:PAS domain S-box-containing protein